MYASVVDPEVALLDAKVSKHLSKMCRENVEALNINRQTFRATEFAHRLAVMARGQSLKKYIKTYCLKKFNPKSESEL